MATGECLVCRLKNIVAIPGADNIVQASMFGEIVIVSKDYKEGDLGLLFDCESQLNAEFAKQNNLYRHSNLNIDPNKVGYLEDTRRVRAIKLRGVKCSALFMPLSSLDYLGKGYPAEGTQIKEWQGKPICEKYVRPTRGSGNNKQIKKIQQVLHFAEHLETDQLMRNLHKINIGDKLIITSKLHGTSCRAGLLPCTGRKWWEKLLEKFVNRKNKYRFVVGSRHALKHVENQAIDKKDSYYEDDIWTESAYKNFHGKLMAGETVYYEIVGFLPSGASIMPINSNEKLKKFLEPKEYKEFIDKFGKETVFHYGCKHGYDYVDNGHAGLEKVFEYKIFVYRITLTTEHGQAIDLSWEQVKRRCEELGVAHVPELEEAYILDKCTIVHYQNEDFWLKKTEKDDPNFPQHLNEGICVRVENGSLRPQVYKSKRYAFKVLEGIIKDNSDWADIEESN